MTKDERKWIKRWEEFKLELFSFEDDSFSGKSHAEIYAHRKWLEARPMEWIKFFLSKHARCEFAPFHLKAIKRLINNPEWFEVLSWARSLSKSTTVMFALLYLLLTGRKKCAIIASATQDAATKLLMPYKKELEKNPRIRAYYGDQMGGKWTDDHIVSQMGFSIMAIGEGNAPRGSKNEESIRPDALVVDDFDTDEACRNPETIRKKWEWWEGALYPTRDIAVPTLVVFCGNIIAKDCCVTRAGALADHWDVINIRDENGLSTWPQKNSEEAINIALRKVSSASGQKEYYNNPVVEGDIFKYLTKGKIPALKKFDCLVVYGDPSPSESKKSKASSYKACWLLGLKEEKLYVIKGFLDKGLNANFIQWYYDLHDYVAGQTNTYHYIENNRLQDPFYKQVFCPMIRKANRKRRETHLDKLTVNEDAAKKTEKATRIESNLEPLDRVGAIIFNEDEADNPHMVRLLDQFALFNLSLSYPADGPDCVEGGLRILKMVRSKKTPTKTIPRKSITRRNRHRM